MRTLADVTARLPSPDTPELSAPVYQPAGFGPKVGLAVKSMARHSTDEGWQLFQGLEVGGYVLQGFGIDSGHPEHGDRTDVGHILNYWQPSTVIIQDKREWEGRTAGGLRGFDERERFTNVHLLAEHPEVFRVTVLKDAHQQPSYHRQAAAEMGCHAWVTYYHPKIVKHFAPYVRSQHLIRTYHTVDRDVVPPYTADGRRSQAFLSGALNGTVYPLRTRLHKYGGGWLHYRMHPGYHRNGADTPAYLKALSHYKVAICTTSIYGYAVRKLVEATAAGCRVITDLPAEDALPLIDGNLVRVPSSTDPAEVAALAKRLADAYDPPFQKRMAEYALDWYDYRTAGHRLAADIEFARLNYKGDGS